MAAVACGLLFAAFVVALYGPSSARTASGLPPAGASSPSADVVVVGWDLVVSYWTHHPGDTSYLKPPDCDGCPEHLTPGSSFSVRLVLNNTDAATPHAVTNLSIEEPLQLVDVSPDLPASLPAGHSVVVQLTLIAPPNAGKYFLAGAIGAN